MLRCGHESRWTDLSCDVVASACGYTQRSEEPLADNFESYYRFLYGSGRRSSRSASKAIAAVATAMLTSAYCSSAAIPIESWVPPIGTSAIRLASPTDSCAGPWGSRFRSRRKLRDTALCHGEFLVSSLRFPATEPARNSRQEHQQHEAANHQALSFAAGMRCLGNREFRPQDSLRLGEAG